MENKYTWIKGQEAGYQKPISLPGGWSYSMLNHLLRSYLYKHSQFLENNDDRELRPFKNIVLPILNIAYRTEGLDVKDITLFVDDEEKYHYSLIVKKFHEKWVLENQLDTFIDELVESFVDYGGVLVKNINEVKPEVVNLLSLAFCDQTNILSGPFAIKHHFNPQELRDMAENGWGDARNGATIDIETLIQLSESKKQQDNQQVNNSTPGNYIEIYEVHGTMPTQWLNKKTESEEKKFTQQIQIVGYYKNKDNQETGVTLFAAKEPKLPFKFLSRDKIFGRALGLGGVEELFEAQVWTNFDEGKTQELLNLASKIFFKTTDARFKTRNNLINADNGEIFDLQPGSDITQLDTVPRNVTIFNNAVAQWENHAQKLGAAGEALMGESPSAGTPFKLQELVTIEAKGLHKWRQGRIAVFLDEIYRDWILPYFAKELVREQKFFAELSVDELQTVAQAFVNHKVNNMVKEKILNGEMISKGEVEAERTRIMNDFMSKGIKRSFKIFKDELKNAVLGVMTNIAGKQKNLALLTDKLVNIVRQFIATPQIRQDPDMIKLLNTILESSGMNPVVFGQTMPVQQPTLQQQTGGSTEALKALGERGMKEMPLTA